MKFKKKTILITFLLLLNSCGYEAIFSSNDSPFAVINIEAEGEKNLNNKITNGLKIYRNIENKSKFYELKIFSEKTKKITSKDKKGNAELFEIQISFKIKVSENGEIISQKTFVESFIYNNNTNKFDLKKYEKNIENNLVTKILDKLVIFLHSI